MARTRTKSATKPPARSAIGRPGKRAGLKGAVAEAAALESVASEASASKASASKASASKSPSSRAMRAAERRQAIIAAGLDEFIARAFAAPRLADVASRPGVAQPTIYLHFRDKEA